MFLLGWFTRSTRILTLVRSKFGVILRLGSLQRIEPSDAANAPGFYIAVVGHRAAFLDPENRDAGEAARDLLSRSVGATPQFDGSTL
jgi:hypothetical protein